MFLLGAGLVFVGLLLVVLPGPLTIPPVLAGLFVWSLEFEFAERLLAHAGRSATTAWQVTRRRPWRTGLATAAGLVVAVAAGVGISRYGVVGGLRRVGDLLG